MSTPTPALVTQRAAQRLPRLALWLFCIAYVVPGFVARDPWRNADLTAYAYMGALADGRTSWFAPSLGGLAGDSALLPYWLGAAFIRLAPAWIEPAFAARLPFLLLLTLTLVCTWYSTYHLARTPAAQPLRFAFGGEASPVDYARAVADGAVLALIGTLGLLQLGHETTPELAQLASVAVFMYGLAAASDGAVRARLAAALALPVLAASGAPAVALMLSAAAALICARSAEAPMRRLAPYMLAGGALAALTGWLLGAWAWRLDAPTSIDDGRTVVRLLAWFVWPSGPLAAWTLWRWRRQLLRRHIAIPLACVAVAVVASIGMGGADRALMLGLPAFAVLAAFALPTLHRSTAAAIDWFSVFFFSLCALVIWVVYVSMQSGLPSQPLANVMRLAPGYVPAFSPLALALACLATLAWVGLVAWRTGRHRHALWKSMVLPAGGVALCWLLLMSLWLPLLDYARSDRPLVAGLAQHLDTEGCVAMPGAQRSRVAALEQLGSYTVDATHGAHQSACRWLLVQERRDADPAHQPGWQFVGRAGRPTEHREVTSIYRRAEGRP